MVIKANDYALDMRACVLHSVCVGKGTFTTEEMYQRSTLRGRKAVW